MSSFVTVILTFFVSQNALGNGTTSLSELLKLANKNNPAILSVESQLDAEESLITSKATLDDPMVGFSNLDRNMETQYGTISQKIRFPAKYYLAAKAQNSRAKAFDAHLKLTKFEVRERVATLYYAIYSTQNILQLTKINMEAVKEFARVAEKKYASGQSTQADSMKAHFELTQLELELIELRQQEQSLQAQLKAVLNDLNFKDIDFSGVKLEAPDFWDSLVAHSKNLKNRIKKKSPKIRTEAQFLEEAEYKSSLAGWEFAPDIQLQYQQRISGEPEDSRIYSVGISFPLWFLNKGSKASAASSMKIAQKYKLEQISQNTYARIQDLIGKVGASKKTLRIYETSLIPQAQGAYNSTRGAYRANKTTFLDLLDSERSLYKVKTGFFRTLKQYVSQLTQLESELGFTVSNLANSEALK